MMSHVESISDLIKDFVALGFIVEIDDQFAKNMSGIDVQSLIDDFQELEICVSETYNKNLWAYITSCCTKSAKLKTDSFCESSDEEEEKE